MEKYLMKVSETFRRVSPFVRKSDLVAAWNNTAIELLCSVDDMDSDLFDSLLETWTVNSSLKREAYCRSAVVTVRETLLQRVERYAVEKIIKILHEIFNLVSEDESVVQSLNHELVLGVEKMKKKMTENAVFNLVASEFLNGGYFPASASSVGQFKPYKISIWIGYLKLALISTTTAIHYAISDEDRDDASMGALLAIEIIRIVSRSTAKLFQVFYLFTRVGRLFIFKPYVGKLRDNLLRRKHQIIKGQCDSAGRKIKQHRGEICREK